MKTEKEELIKLACAARKHSHSPYSHFKVGAALLCGNGKVFTGCNIENASYSLTNCAERTVIFKAVSELGGKAEFTAIAIVGGNGAEADELCFPCGACLQVMSEFCKDDFKIFLADKNGIKEYTLRDMLPNRFILTK